MRQARKNSTHDRVRHAAADTINRRAIVAGAIPAGLAGSVIAAGCARTVCAHGEAIPDEAGLPIRGTPGVSPTTGA